MTESAVTEPIPTDIDALAELLRDLRWQDRDQIRDRLVIQLGDKDEAWRLYGNAESLVRYEETVTRLRAQLREALGAVETDLCQVTQILGELGSNELYDVEYAESGRTDDMRAFLADAARMIRAAAALNPCPAEMVTSA